MKLSTNITEMLQNTGIFKIQPLIHYRTLSQVITIGLALVYGFFFPVRLVTSAELVQVSPEVSSLSPEYPQKSDSYVKLTKLTFSPSKRLLNNSVDFERLADAIKRAENSKRHPYGIIKPYCGPKTEARCRKGCLQTIKKRYRMWQELPKDAKHSQDYLEYLASSYAPLGAKNDPSGLNKHWIGNVRRIYEQLG